MLRIFFVLLVISTCCYSEELPKEEKDGHESRKILGSSVVTSVSVITNSVNGEKKPSFVNAMGQQVPKPHIASQIASPINLLNPDRYEFYTFNNDGELVKRLMTLEEIQGIIASGDTENNQFNYELNITPSSENEVSDIVENVQIVLQKEIEAHKNASKDKINLDTPDVSETWNVILPTIFGTTGSSLQVSDLVHKSTFSPSPSPIHSSTTRSESSPYNANIEFTTTRPTTFYKPSSTHISSILPFVVTNTAPPTTKVTADTTKTSEATSFTQEVREKPSSTIKTTASTFSSTRKPPTTIWSTTTEVKRYTTSPLNSIATKYTSQMVPHSTKITVGTKNPEINTTPMTSREAESPTTFKRPDTTTTPVSTTLMPLNDLIKTFYSQTVMNITTEAPRNYTLIKETVTRKPEIRTTTKYTLNKISEAVNQDNSKVTLRVTSATKVPTTSSTGFLVQVKEKPEPTTVKPQNVPQKLVTTVFRPEKSTTTHFRETTPLPTTIKDPEIMNSIKDIATTMWQEIYSNTERNKPSDIVSDLEDKYVNDGDDRDTISTTEFPLSKNTEPRTELPTTDFSENFDLLNLETTRLPSTWLFNTQNEFTVSNTDAPKETTRPFLANRFGTTNPVFYSSSLSTDDSKKTTTKLPLTVESGFSTKNDGIKPIYNRFTSVHPISITTPGLEKQSLETRPTITTFTTVQSTKPTTLTTKFEVEDTIKPIYSRITTIQPIMELKPMSEFLVSNPPKETAKPTQTTTTGTTKTTTAASTEKVTELEQTKENVVKTNSHKVTTKKPKPTELPKETVKVHMTNKIEVKTSPATLAPTKIETKPTEITKTTEKSTTPTKVTTEKPKTTTKTTVKTTVSSKVTEKLKSTTQKPTTEAVKIIDKTTPTLTTLLTTKIAESILKDLTSSLPTQSTFTTTVVGSSSSATTLTTEKSTATEKSTTTEKITATSPVVNASVPYRKTEDTWKLVATIVPPTMAASTKPSTMLPDIPIDYYQQPTKIDLSMQGNFGVQTLSEDMYTFSKLYNEIALKFWSTLSADHISPERSVVVSPFGAISTLSMIFLGARGSTSGEMNDLLKLDDIVTFNPHLKFKEVTESVTARRSSAIVRELYSDNTKGKIFDFYKERVKQFYDGHVEEIDFKVINDVVRRRTNLLIRKQTRGHMKQYLGDTNFVLKGPLAALSMNIFQSECRTASTKGRDGEIYFIVLPSMRQRRLVPIPAAVWRSDFIAGYDPELDATAVSIGSANQAISTIFVMPGQQGHSAPGDVLLRLEARLLDTSYMPQTWTQLLRSMLPRPNLEVQIPRFSHKSIINITNSLKKMGLKEMFDPKKSDLRGLTGSKHNLYFSDILQVNEFTNCGETQQLHMEMYPSYNETDYQMEQLRSYRYFEEQRRRYTHIPLPLRPRQARLPEVARLRFDRPFLYFVRHNPTGLILHMGRFNPKLLP